MAVEEFAGKLDGVPTDEQLAAQDAALGIPLGTTRKQLMAESSLIPGQTSPKGAMGIAQIIQPTVDHWSQQMGRKLDPFNVDDALLMHRLTMKQNLDKFGNLPDALRAYNSGWTPSKWDNSETNNYLAKILDFFIPSAHAGELPKAVPFTGKLDGEVPAKAAQVEEFTGQLDPAIEEFNGQLDSEKQLPTWTEALKETAKSLYEVPAAMASGLVGGLGGLVAGGVASLAEQAGFAQPGAGLATAKAVEGAMPFLNPSSPVSQTVLEGMQTIAPSNITHLATEGFSKLTGIPEQPETFATHATDVITNMFLGGRKPLEALGEIASKGEPLPPAPPKVVPQVPEIAPKSIPEIPATPKQEIPVPPEPTMPEPMLAPKAEVQPSIATPAAAEALIKDVVDTTNVSAATKKLDTALRQVESGLVESNQERIPLAVTNEQAAALGYDPMKMLSQQFGRPLTSAEVVQAQNLTAAADKHLVSLMEKVVAGEEVPQETLMKAIATKNTITDYLQKGLGENARAMRASQQAPVTSQAMDMGIKSMMDNFGDRQMRQQAAQAILNAANDPALLAQTTRALAEPTAHAKINQIIVNSFLTSPLTLKVAMISQATMPLLYVGDQAIGATLGLANRAVAAALGKPKPDVVTFGEVGANLAGLYHGAVEGWQVAKHAWKTEEPTALPSERQYGSTNVFGPGPVSRLFNTPARAILTQDQFYKALAYRMTLNGVAERTAWKAGLTGKDRAIRAEQVRNTPSDLEVKLAEDAARDYTFTRDLGSIGRSISNMSNTHPLVKLNLPFVKIGINLGKQLVEHSPLALTSPRFYKDISSTPTARNAAVAKMLVGTMFLNQMYQLAQQGKLTGSAPKDGKQRPAWQALHPEDSYLGDDGQWHSHKAFGAISTMMSAAAELAETWNTYQQNRLIDQTIGTPEDGALDDTHSKAFWSLANTLYEAFIDQTWFRTMATVVNTITSDSPDRMSDGAGRYIAGLLPASPGMGFMTRQMDTTMRRTSDSILDPLRDRLPWESEKLLPKIDPITGEARQRPDQLQAVPQNFDPTISEMVRLGVQIPYVPNKFTINDGGQSFRPDMTPEEQNYITQFRGKYAKPVVDELIQRPNWDKLPDQSKRNLIVQVYNNFQTLAEQILTSKMAQDNKERLIVEVRRALLNTSKGQPLLPPQLELK